MLGPMCIIASLSLGATRTFRIRRVGAAGSEADDPGDAPRSGAKPLQPVPAQQRGAHQQQHAAAAQQAAAVDMKPPGSKAASTALTTVDVELRHNSLLIMWPPMQEEWKHEVDAVMDVIRYRPRPLGHSSHSFACHGFCRCREANGSRRIQSAASRASM